MREYTTHFSFYDEQWGNFADAAYRVEAANPFEARQAAWALCDKDDDTRFRRNIKLYAVTWQPNLLNMEDYFNSQAADIKEILGRIEYVDTPNDRINHNERSDYWQREKAYYFGYMQAIDAIAKDLFADKGMAPPSVHEELYYAEKLCERLGYGEQVDALWNKIDLARQWDAGAMCSLRDLFQKGYTELCGEAVFFSDHFGKDGVYPLHADIEDRSDYPYISRWHRAVKVEKLNRLPMLQEEAVIPDSRVYMDFEGYVLVMDKNHFKEEYQTPENMLWQASHGNGCRHDAIGRSVWAENVITGEQVAFYRQDFLGVLKPELYANMDFEALKNEYSQLYGNNSQEEEDEMCDDD